MDLQLPSLEIKIMQPLLCGFGILLFGELDGPFVVFALLRPLVPHVPRQLLVQLLTEFLLRHAGRDMAYDDFVGFVACGILLGHVCRAEVVART